jgi:hypothetical protein
LRYLLRLGMGVGQRFSVAASEKICSPIPKEQTVCGNLQALGHHHATKLQPSHFSADGLWQDDDF